MNIVDVIRLGRIIGLAKGGIRAWEQVGNDINTEGLIYNMREILGIAERLMRSERDAQDATEVENSSKDDNKNMEG